MPSKSSLRRALNTRKKLLTKAARKGVTAANKILVRAAKAKAPTATKALRKNLGQKVKQYRKGTVVLGIVGPRIGPAVVATVKGAPVVRDPVRYAPAVEKGHGTYRGAQFIRGAMREQERAIEAAMAKAVSEVLDAP
jgi:HK97 gp10 family phage protein